MKKYNKWIFNVASGLALTSVIATSCVDEIKFGNSFLEKAPGGSVTKDTVFNNAEYTRQFLTNLYGMQYYGLPYKNVANQESSNQYVGKPEALTDLYVFTYPSCGKRTGSEPSLNFWIISSENVGFKPSPVFIWL